MAPSEPVKGNRPRSSHLTRFENDLAQGLGQCGRRRGVKTRWIVADPQYDHSMAELTDLRRRVRQAMQDAKRNAAQRREARDEASKAWDTAVAEIVEPAATQMAAALTGEGVPFRLETPRGTIRLVSERSKNDYIEIVLDAGDERDVPEVIGRNVVGRGRQGVTLIEESLGAPSELTDDAVTEFLLKAIGPWIR